MPQPANISRPLPTQRSRTPSDLKWLLNERAALAGELYQLQQQVNLLTAKERAAHDLLCRLGQEREDLEARKSDLTERTASMDRVIDLAHPTVDPAAGGLVRAHSGRWGARGALTGFLRDTLRTAAPQALPTATLLACALAHFRVYPANSDERMRLHFVLRRRLRALRDEAGLVESTRAGDGARDDVLWRWKQPSSLDALRALAAAAEAPDDDPPHPDAL